MLILYLKYKGRAGKGMMLSCLQFQNCVKNSKGSKWFVNREENFRDDYYYLERTGGVLITQPPSLQSDVSYVTIHFLTRKKMVKFNV